MKKKKIFYLYKLPKKNKKFFKINQKSTSNSFTFESKLTIF
jgi:hypothetical protein